MLPVQTRGDLNVVGLVLVGNDAMSNQEVKHYAAIGWCELSIRERLLEFWDGELHLAQSVSYMEGLEITTQEKMLG